MRVLYLSQYFPPEVGATQTRAHEMARGLASAGHEVTVIGEIPNHPSGIIPDEYKGKLYERSKLDGFDVIRVWVYATPNKTFITRLLFYITYMWSAIFAGLFLAKGPFDVIYATSPPLFVGGAGFVISLLRRTPFVFEVRDLWPESAVELGELNNKWAIKLAEWLESLCYWRARHIVSVTGGIHDRLLKRGFSESEVTLITNGANTELFKQIPEKGREIREQLNLQDKFIVLYAGIHGIAQGLSSVIETANILKDKKEVHFLFVGEGPVKAKVKEQAQQLNLDNVTFHSELPRARMPEFYSAADVSLVPLRKLELFQGALPSKMFDSWACECPLLLSVDGEARDLVEKVEGGLFVAPEDSTELAKDIEKLMNLPDRGKSLGLNGRKITEQKYSRAALAKELERLLVEKTTSP